MNRPSQPRPMRDHIRVAADARQTPAMPREQEFDDAKLMFQLQSGTDQQGVRLVHLHLSLLENSELTDTVLILRLLTEAASNSSYQQIFNISNGDIVMFYKAVKFSVIEDACKKIEALLLAKSKMKAATNPYREEAIYSILELSLNFVHVIRYLEGIMKADGSLANDASKKPAITPDALAKIDSALAQFDLSPYVFNQAVISLQEDDPRHREFYELYISMKELEARLSPDFDLGADRWLFRHFTASLDRALLRSLNHGLDFIGKHSFSININLSTALSRVFEQFDERLPAAFRGNVVLEIAATDLMENIHLYQELLSFASRHDYRICIDGLNEFWAVQLDFESLGCHYAKLFWSNDMLTQEGDAERAFREKIEASHDAPYKFILARCGAVTGLLYANKSGIDLVQGHAVDSVLRKGLRIGDAIKTARLMDD